MSIKRRASFISAGVLLVVGMILYMWFTYITTGGWVSIYVGSTVLVFGASLILMGARMAEYKDEAPNN